MHSQVFRVIGGPKDGDRWGIDGFEDDTLVYVNVGDNVRVQHLYRFSTTDMTARYEGHRLAEREEE